MNEELFDRFDSLTFDDVLIIPGYTDVLPNETDVCVQLTPQISLNIPILSAAMDTVTEARLAIALAREGGMGIIHRNMPPEAQAAEVEKVKRSQAGMIVEPISLSPDALLSEAESIMSTYHISGVPITDENGRLVGILTNRDIRFVETADYSSPVHEFMTREEDLVTARVGISAKEAKDILQKHRIEKLPLVDENGMLKGLLTVKDIQKARDYPNAATDVRERLIVGAAVGVGKDLETRVDLMVKAGVDAITIDTAQHHGIPTGDDRLDDVAAELDSAIRNDSYAVFLCHLRTFKNRRDLRHARTGDDSGGANGPCSHTNLYHVGS